MVPPGRIDHLPAFPNVVRGRLLHIDVLAGLAGPDGTQRVPVLLGGDAHHVDVFPVQQLADVGVLIDLLVKVLFAKLRGGGRAGAIGIANGDDLHPFLRGHAGDVGAAAADAQAHHADADFVVGSPGPRRNQ